MTDKIYARTVIFDGDCGFCQRSIRLGKKLDWLKKMEWRARLESGIKERFPQITGEQSLHQMITIRPDGKVNGGFYAVRDIALHLPLTFLPALILFIPGMHLLGVPGYRWIARNRHRFGGKSEDSCSIQ